MNKQWECKPCPYKEDHFDLLEGLDVLFCVKPENARFDPQERLEYIVRACNTFADIEEGVSMIVEKDHYYQLEAQAKSQPDLLVAGKNILGTFVGYVEGSIGGQALKQLEDALAGKG